MQDRPTPEELLDAVASFLRERVVVATGGALAYHARVAANALDIARRQIALEPAARRREQAALARLLDTDSATDVEQLNRLLCERIAAGTIGLHTPGLADGLWQITLDKLAIDQPGYATDLREPVRTAPDGKDS